MFETLTQRLSRAFERLRSRGTLSEAEVTEALREVRIALLEADVALPVVKDFIAAIKEQAVGVDVIRSISPDQQVVKIVHDHLIKMLGSEPVPLNLAANPPVVIMMVGLQGSGKTTTTAKLANFLKQRQKKKLLMASLDIYRPAAREQLALLGEKVNVSTLPIIPNELPLTITQRALEMGRLEGYDVILLDTAGRLHIDDELMEELIAVKQMAKPLETLLVADAMTGQDAVKVASTFHQKINVTGIVLTRLDGDARGGAALSMRTVTGCPIKFAGMGEQIEALEEFHPQRIASRILDMGDIVSLVEKAAASMEEEDLKKMAAKMESGSFDLNDMAQQLKQLMKMGGISSFLSMLPGIGRLQDQLKGANMDDRPIKRQIAIINSMTLQERRDAKIMNASRRRRIALGAGVTVADVNRLLRQFQEMAMMMKRMRKMGEKGLRRQGLRSLLPRL